MKSVVIHINDIFQANLNFTHKFTGQIGIY